MIDTPAFVAKADYDKVVEALASMTTFRDNVISDRDILRKRIESFKEEIKQFVIDHMDSYVTTDDLTTLAETFEVELTQQISFSVNVNLSGYLTVPLNADLDDISDNIATDLHIDLSYNGEYDNFEFEYPDIDVTDVEVQ